MKKYRQGMILIQGLFVYLLIIFVVLFSIEMLSNVRIQLENQRRSMLVHQIIKEEVSHMKQGGGVREGIRLQPFDMEITLINERICVSYEDGNQNPQTICSP